MLPTPTTPPALRRVAPLLVLVSLILPLGVSRTSAEALPPVGAIPRAVLTPDREPAGPFPARVTALWQESVRCEEQGDLEAAAGLRRRILAHRPDDVHTGWRLARDLVRLGESLPRSRDGERLAAYEEAFATAHHARRVDPRCAECCLYEFAALGRIANARGVFESVATVREASELLPTCLGMQEPTWTDTPDRRENGNLYLGAAMYFRLLPDSWWAERLLGVRGDADAAVHWARKAVDVTPERVDYVVELGLSLLCQGHRLRDPERRMEGLELLERALTLPDVSATDPVDRARAERVLRDPSGACNDARPLGHE